MLLLSPASPDTHFPSSFVLFHWFWCSILKKEVVLVYFHSSFVVTEDTNSVKSCQHANTCWFLCLLLDCYVDATHYVLNMWFQIAIRDCSRSRPESVVPLPQDSWFRPSSQQVRIHPRLLFLSLTSALSPSACPKCFSHQRDCPHCEHP